MYGSIFQSFDSIYFNVSLILIKVIKTRYKSRNVEKKDILQWIEFFDSFFGTNIFPKSKGQTNKSRREGKQNRLFLSFVVACAEIHAYLIKPTWRNKRGLKRRFPCISQAKFGSGRSAMPPRITRVQFVVACNIKTVPSFVTRPLQPSIPLTIVAVSRMQFTSTSLLPM